MAKTRVQTVERKTSVPRSTFREAFTGVFGKSSSRDAKTAAGSSKETAPKSASVEKKSK